MTSGSHDLSPLQLQQPVDGGRLQTLHQGRQGLAGQPPLDIGAAAVSSPCVGGEPNHVGVIVLVIVCVCVCVWVGMGGGGGGGGVYGWG